jgi:hypothetical protein
MEALPASELPSGPGWQYEPKWDETSALAPGQISMDQVQREHRTAMGLL